MSFFTGVNKNGYKFMNNVVYIGDKFITGVKDTCYTFMTGVAYTGDKFLESHISANVHEN